MDHYLGGFMEQQTGEFNGQGGIAGLPRGIKLGAKRRI
jgi:hypothetical protein